MKSTSFLVMLVIICMGILVFGLWPFNFLPSNHVAWLKESNGIELGQRGIVYTPAPLSEAVRSALLAGALTMEIALRPHGGPPNGLGWILALCGEDWEAGFLVAQWKESLLVFEARPGSRIQSRRPQMGVGEALPDGQVRFITITWDPTRTAFFLDGNLARQYPGRKFLAGHTRGPSHLLIGNSPSGKNPWPGNLLGITLYDRPLGGDEIRRHAENWRERQELAGPDEDGLLLLYPFREKRGDVAHNLTGRDVPLWIPHRLHPPRPAVLELPTGDSFLSLSMAQDVLINILGFLPLGALLAAWLGTRRRAVDPGSGSIDCGTPPSIGDGGDPMTSSSSPFWPGVSSVSG
jgi:hypothetical protein